MSGLLPARAAADLVPKELLLPADPAESRKLDRDLAAEMLDPYLRRLGSQESRCRRVLGRLASAFLGRQGHHLLGFARISDYSRERLGISASELRSLAHVSEGLGKLSKTAAAFERGEISWSKLRLLVDVATLEDEEEWLFRAKGMSVRELSALIRNRKEAGAPASSSVVDEESGEKIEGEKAVAFRVRCPRRVRRLWREVVSLAKKVVGADGPLWRLVEAIGAEASSSVSPVPASSSAASLRRTFFTLPDEERDDGKGRRPPELWAEVVEAIPTHVEALLLGCDSADPAELDQRMRVAVSAMQTIAWQTGRLLRVFLGYRLYLYFDYPSGEQYVRERLGMSDRTARALVRVDRATIADDAFSDAYHRGELSWIRATTLIPVVEERHGKEWIERAREVTLRRLALEVEWARDVRDAGPWWKPVPPPPMGSLLVSPERQMCAPRDYEPADAEVGFTGPESVVRLFEDVIRSWSLRFEPPWRGLERILEAVKGEWEALPRHRDPVFERDDFQCLVPGCTSRQRLQDHHFEFRSHGGSDEEDNRGTLCVWHHLRGIHQGIIRAKGKPPHEVRWELGIRRDARPALVFEGDRYCS